MLQIHIEKIFKIDETSPSRLAWNIDIYCGIHNNVHKIKVGDHCDHISKTTGRYVVQHKDKIYQVARVVWCLENGDIPENLIIDHIDGNPLNNKTDNLQCKTLRANNQNVKSRIEGTLAGVNHRLTSLGYEYWTARWTDSNGKNHEKFFSVSKLGYDVAKEQATQHRFRMIEELNEQGQQYTERHGK